MVIEAEIFVETYRAENEQIERKGNLTEICGSKLTCKLGLHCK